MSSVASTWRSAVLPDGTATTQATAVRTRLQSIDALRGFVMVVMLLDHVRKVLTKKLHILIPLGELDTACVEFLENNIKSHPGNAELNLQIMDENGLISKLRSHHIRVEINDDLIQYLEGHTNMKFSLEIS